MTNQGPKPYNPRRFKPVKLKPRQQAAAAGGSSNDDAGIDLDKPIFTLSVASEILETHPRTLMMYEHLEMVRPKRTVTNRRRYSRRDVMKLQAIQTLTRQHGVNLAGVRYILVLLKRLQAAGIEPPEGLRNLDVSLIDV
jgi:hypothetical protein